MTEGEEIVKNCSKESCNPGTGPRKVLGSLFFEVLRAWLNRCPEQPNPSVSLTFLPLSRRLKQRPPEVLSNLFFSLVILWNVAKCKCLKIVLIFPKPKCFIQFSRATLRCLQGSETNVYFQIDSQIPLWKIQKLYQNIFIPSLSDAQLVASPAVDPDAGLYSAVSSCNYSDDPTQVPHV